MNKRYCCVGSKKELSEKGLLKGGFLKKKKVNNAAIDKSLFKAVDVRSFKTLKLQPKKPKVVSGNAQGSYTIEFARYSAVPANVQQQLASKFQLHDEDE